MIKRGKMMKEESRWSNRMLNNEQGILNDEVRFPVIVPFIPNSSVQYSLTFINIKPSPINPQCRQLRIIS